MAPPRSLPHTQAICCNATSEHSHFGDRSVGISSHFSLKVSAFLPYGWMRNTFLIGRTLDSRARVGPADVHRYRGAVKPIGSNLWWFTKDSPLCPFIVGLVSECVGRGALGSGPVCLVRKNCHYFFGILCGLLRFRITFYHMFTEFIAAVVFFSLIDGYFYYDN